MKRGIIIGAVIFVVLLGVGYGVYSYGQYQQTAKQKAALNSAPITGVTQVAASNYAFNPINIQVPVGTTVTWTNTDDAPHTITFDNGMADSGTFTKGQSYHYTFTKPGVFNYHCAVHPEMIGRVTVTP